MGARLGMKKETSRRQAGWVDGKEQKEFMNENGKRGKEQRKG